MKDIVHMVLTEFWPFVAAVVLVSTVFDGIAGVVKAFRSKRGDA
ncbi:hypothetical protein ACSYS7_001766 [Stenotrophomonas maltophilia]